MYSQHANVIVTDEYGNLYRLGKFYQSVEEFKTENEIKVEIDAEDGMEYVHVKNNAKSDQLIFYKRDFDNDILSAVGGYSSGYDINAEVGIYGWSIGWDDYNDGEMMISEEEVLYLFDLILLTPTND